MTDFSIATSRLRVPATKSFPRLATAFAVMLITLGVLPGFAQSTATNSPAAPAPAATTPATSTTLPTLSEAAKLYNAGKVDEALVIVNAVVQAQPQSINGYILRGALYSAKHDWANAQKDFESALAIDPKNDGVRYDLADLKFKQKRFDEARAAFVPLQNNPDSDVSDLIKYKIFICDLALGHEDDATKELAVFNQAGENASYYFGNIAWSLFHKKPDEARDWIASASRIYPPRKQLLYAMILKDLGYLPLPDPAAAK